MAQPIGNQRHGRGQGGRQGDDHAQGQDKQPRRLQGQKQARNQDGGRKQTQDHRFLASAAVRPGADQGLANQGRSAPGRKQYPDLLARPADLGQLERQQHLNRAQRRAGHQNDQTGTGQARRQELPQGRQREGRVVLGRGAGRRHPVRNDKKGQNGQDTGQDGKIQERLAGLTKTAQRRPANRPQTEGDGHDAHFQPALVFIRQTGGQRQGRRPGCRGGRPLGQPTQQQGPKARRHRERHRSQAQHQHPGRQPQALSNPINHIAKGQIQQQGDQAIRGVKEAGPGFGQPQLPSHRRQHGDNQGIADRVGKHDGGGKDQHKPA